MEMGGGMKYKKPRLREEEENRTSALSRLPCGCDLNNEADGEGAQKRHDGESLPA